jgi:flagellar basal body-associated protein FliL
MNKNIIITILVLLVLAGVGYYFFTKFRASTLAPELPQPTTQPVSGGLTTLTPSNTTSNTYYRSNSKRSHY